MANAFISRSIGLFAVVAALSGACGSEAEVLPGTALEVTIVDFGFEPDAWAVTAGTEFDVTLVNTGFNEHEWVVLEQGLEIESESDFSEDRVLARIDKVARDGGLADSTFSVDEAGTYQVICSIGGHFTAGMEGTLTVVAG
jgi:plastocyanin